MTSVLPGGEDPLLKQSQFTAKTSFIQSPHFVAPKKSQSVDEVSKIGKNGFSFLDALSPEQKPKKPFVFSLGTAPPKKTTKVTQRNRRISNTSDVDMKPVEESVLQPSDTEDEEDQDESLYMTQAFRPFRARRKEKNPTKTKPKTNSRRVSFGSVNIFIGDFVQVCFNVTVLVAVCYFAIMFVMSIKADIDAKAVLATAELVKEGEMCAKYFKENRCEDKDRPPALEIPCRTWENCMRRDPLKVARSQLSAETIAEVLNSFVDPLTYKTMGFLLGSVLGVVFVSNKAFNMAKGSNKGNASRAEESFDDDDEDESFHSLPPTPYGYPPYSPYLPPPAFMSPMKTPKKKMLPSSTKKKLIGDGKTKRA